jgi:hypothetical protein
LWPIGAYVTEHPNQHSLIVIVVLNVGVGVVMGGWFWVVDWNMRV